jgi:hypothetical protein
MLVSKISGLSKSKILSFIKKPNVASRCIFWWLARQRMWRKDMGEVWDNKVEPVVCKFIEYGPTGETEPVDGQQEEEDPDTQFFGQEKFEVGFA